MAMINFDYVGLLQTIQGFEQIKYKSETIINNVLHSFGSEEIKGDIIPLIHNSGREWNGKPKHANQTQPFRDKKENLGLIIRSKTNYGYLYFP